MKTRKTPIGQPESNRLEFKSADLLKNPLKIGRAVAAMLNARGGEIWIGIREQDGKAVAEEPIDAIHDRRRDLQNHLIDTLEPSPAIPGELSLTVVPCRSQGEVLCIAVAEGRRRPYALLRDGGRLFPLRVSDRVRTMSREELASAFVDRHGDKDALAETIKQILEERAKALGDGPRIWMRIEPSPPLDLSVQDDDLRGFLTDAASTDNRRDGWTFVLEREVPRLKAGAVFVAGPINWRTEIRSSGGILFHAPLERLAHGERPPKHIYPYALIELPQSLMRLASHVLKKKAEASGHLVVDLALVSARDWSLRAGSPNPHFPSPHVKQQFEDDDLILPRPLVFTADEMRSKPDLCGLRLIRQVYQAFGFGDGDLPPELDRGTGRLNLR